MSFRLVNDLILEHLRWFGYQLEARILERELKAKMPTQRSQNSRLMDLISKCIEKFDDSDGQGSGPIFSRNVSNSNKIGLSNKGTENINNPKSPPKFVSQNYQARRNQLEEANSSKGINQFIPNNERRFLPSDSSNLTSITKALRNRRGSHALALNPATGHAHDPQNYYSDLPPSLQTESSPNRKNNSNSYSQTRGNSGHDSLMQPPLNGYPDIENHQQKYYNLRGMNNGLYEDAPSFIKKAGQKSNAVNASYQTPPRRPHNKYTQSLDNSLMGDMDPNQEQTHSFNFPENSYSYQKGNDRDHSVLKSRPYAESWNPSINYINNNNLFNSKEPEKVSPNNHQQRTFEPFAPPYYSKNPDRLVFQGGDDSQVTLYPQQERGKSQKPAQKLEPLWRQNPSPSKLGFTKEPSPFSKADLLGSKKPKEQQKAPLNKVAVSLGGPRTVKAPHIDPKLLENLMANTSFNENEIRSLYEAYKIVMNTGDITTPPMNKQKFKEFLFQARNIHGEHFSECVFYFGPQLSLITGDTIEFREAVHILDKINHDNPFGIMHFVFRLSTGEEYKEANIFLVETLLKEMNAANTQGRITILLDSLAFIKVDGRLGQSDFLSFEDYLEITRGFEPMRKYC